MNWACRILLLLSFALFWGGLTFYTGIVVRISHDVLDDPMEGGLITQRVTSVLQILGVITAAIMLINSILVARQTRKLGYALMVCVTLLTFALIGLFIVHGHLDSVIDAASFAITDYEVFEAGHRHYNQLTTIEWLASLTYLVITVFAWRRADAVAILATDG